MADTSLVPTSVSDPTPDVPKASWIWLKDSAGFPSVTVTFATVSFWVTTLLYITSAVGKIGPVEFRPFDVAAASAYFVPILTLYFGRKWTDAKTSQVTTTANSALQVAASKATGVAPLVPSGINPRLGGDPQ